MAPASTSVLVVHELLQTAAICFSVPRRRPGCLLLLQEAPQDQQVQLTQGLFKLLSLCEALEYVKSGAHPLRAEPLFPAPLWLSHMQAPLVYTKPDMH